jgi:Protein of unknown function (DUF1552)
MAKKRIFSIARRPFLAGLSSAAGAAMFVRPIVAEAQAGAAPKRFFAFHYGCGTVLGTPAGAGSWGFGAGAPWTWLPTGSGTNITLSPLLNLFAPIRSKMLTIHGLLRGDKDQQIDGDKHTHGMVYMMNGWVPVPMTNAAPEDDKSNAKNITSVDPSIDQRLLTKLPAVFRDPLVAGGRPTQFPSIQLCASPDSMLSSPASFTCLKVISYAGKDKPMGPEGRSQTAFNNYFGSAMMPGVDPAVFARQQAQKRSILDFVIGDLQRLQPMVPVAQRGKLDEHVTAIRNLEARITDQPPPAGQIVKPTLVSEPSGAYEKRVKEVHANNLAIIRCAFQSDLTRVATFTSAGGNNTDQVNDYFNPAPFAYQGDGHGCSHNGKTTDAMLAKGTVSKLFLEAVAKMLSDMDLVKEVDGTVLDNTLAVVFSECSDGDQHSPVFPVAWFGGKWIKLVTGQHLNITPERYVNDAWRPMLDALGDTAAFGDPKYSKGAIPGIIGT